ncbi:CidA/LrgA family protein [Mangrovibrevibacter kandeliae]|uniref:CidA/LrgA family protein n=1 Tax=Mangrovibrevibacter kandeliae TaxID=2968473 RepID=UPI002117B2EF|nr:CidA/LrgA family protein [Aurantimonas sp. CSK15Z-1]MCQ8784121.1 CidA/LrgA family protein [Aurantimonas sp. CSK15Z-1]
MLAAVTAIFACQLAGESIAAALGLPLPGPVLGMVFLFAFLVLRSAVPEALERASSSLLSHLTLLFVPASVGVMVHVGRIEKDIVVILAAIVVSTFATMIAAGWTLQALTRGSRKPPADAAVEAQP